MKKGRLPAICAGALSLVIAITAQATPIVVVDHFNTSEIDPNIGAVYGLEYFDERLWMLGNLSLSAIDTETRNLHVNYGTCSFPESVNNREYCAHEARALAYDGNALWIGRGTSLFSIEPYSGKVLTLDSSTKNANTGSLVSAFGLTWISGQLWIADFRNFIHLYDPELRQVVFSTEQLHWNTWAFESIGSYILTPYNYTDFENSPKELILYDPIQGEIVDRWTGLPERVGGIIYDGHDVWIADQPLHPIYNEPSGDIYRLNLPGLEAYTHGTVPTPGTLAMLAIGLAGLGFARKKKHS